MMKIKTDRLIIIPLSNIQMQETINKESCIEIKNAFLEMYNNSINHPKDRIWYVMWGIYVKDNLIESIGNFCFKGPSVKGVVEIGYGINDKYQNNGYMTETLIAITNWAIKQEKIKSVIAETTIDNIASIKVLEKSGFIFTGIKGNECPIYKFLGEQMLDIKLNGLDENGNERQYSLLDFKNKKVVLYFYPKDNTSGCTQEACDFRDNMSRLLSVAKVVGVSPDSIKSHKNFKIKQSLNYILLSDTEHKLAEFFNVWKEKSMYGRKYMGIERSTFILNENSEIIQEWRKVKVNGHIDTILKYLKNL